MSILIGGINLPFPVIGGKNGIVLPTWILVHLPYPAILPRFYPHFTQILLTFYPDFTHILPRFYPHFTQIVPTWCFNKVNLHHFARAPAGWLWPCLQSWQLPWPGPLGGAHAEAPKGPKVVIHQLFSGIWRTSFSIFSGVVIEPKFLHVS